MEYFWMGVGTRYLLFLMFSISRGRSLAAWKLSSCLTGLGPVTLTGILSYFSKLIPTEIPIPKRSSTGASSFGM